MNRHTRIVRAGAVLLLTLLAATGCAASSDGDDPATDAATPAAGSVDPTTQAPGGTPAVDENDLTAQLPDDVRDAGMVTVATSLYAPVDFYEDDGETLTGFDHDLVEAAAARLGLEVQWEVIDFASVIPGIESGQYDFATDVNDTAEREQVVDFVTTFQDGTSIVVQAGNPEGVAGLEDLCGLDVVVTQGSTQVALLEQVNADCTDAATPVEVPDDPDALLAMQSGRADVYLVNTLAGSYAAAQQERPTEILDGVYDEVQAGWIFPKDSTQLRDVFHQTVQALIDDGTYGDIMAEWGLEANMIEQSQINAAGGA